MASELEIRMGLATLGIDLAKVEVQGGKAYTIERHGIGTADAVSLADIERMLDDFKSQADGPIAALLLTTRNQSVDELGEKLTKVKYSYLMKVANLIGADTVMWGMPIPSKWTEVAFSGLRTLRASDPLGGKKPAITLLDPTWADIWKACGKLVRESGDTDHFIITDLTEEDDDVIEAHFWDKGRGSN